MAASDYARTLQVAAAPGAAFAALTTGFDQWWTVPDAALKAVGDRARFSFPPMRSYWTFEAVELTPDRRVELVCVDALHIHEGQPREIETEWLGSRLVFDIMPDGEGSRIAFAHRGLKPDLLCFDICAAGWDHFFGQSLQLFLDTGTGTPHRA